MTIRVAICPDQGLLVWLFSGSLELDEFSEAAQLLAKAPAFNPQFDEIVCFDSQMSLANLDLNVARKIVMIVGSILGYNKERTAKTAFVANEQVQIIALGLPKAMADLDDGVGADVQIFAFLKDACKWLGKDATIVDKLIANAFRDTDDAVVQVTQPFGPD